jgi:hypothetical protein
MNDNDLIDELRDGMRARTAAAEVPEGFVDHARRTARRRSARRAAAVGTPLLAAAGVATVLATGASSHGSSAHGAQAPNLPADGGQIHDTAYIVGRVQANIVAASQNGTVVQSDDYRTGQVSSDGSLANLGWKMDDGYEYAAPDGTEYSSETQYWQDGTVQLATFDSYVPAAGGDGTDSETVINPASHEFSQRQYQGTPDPDGGAGPDLFSTPSQVQQALQSGHVAQLGSATINGTHAIALSVAVPSNPPQTTILYVDAQSYRPLRLVRQVNGGGHVLLVQNWVPATPANIGMAKNQAIPSGYRRATPAEVY